MLKIKKVQFKRLPMGLFNFRKNDDSVRLAKTETGDWMVKKGFSILYIGSKEKCETFMKTSQLA